MRRILSILLFSLFASTTLLGTEGEILATVFKIANTDSVYDFAETMPEIEGGLPSLYSKINYPVVASMNKIEGSVYVKFIVDEKGKVINPVVIKDIGYGCGEEAIAALSKVKFKPGIHEGKPVKVQFILPVRFKLDN